MDFDTALEVLGTIVGIIYLIFEIKANPLVWVAGVIMPAISLFVYFNAGLYADFAINIYYLVAALYGLFLWTRGSKSNNKSELPITHTPIKSVTVVVVVSIVLFVVIGKVLQSYTDSNVPWADSFTTALSIVGMWMLAKKYIEQWFVWIVVDAVCCVLYIYKEIPFYAGLYGLYTIVAVYGYMEWKQMMVKNEG